LSEMFLAIALLLLALIGILPIQYALPLALASLVFGALTFWMMQRRLRSLPVANGREAMLGAVGPALTSIDDDGQIRLGNEIWSARSIGGAIARGEPVRVVRFSGLRALVVPARLTSGS
jgi:membrane-bound ClpP family serine protease